MMIFSSKATTRRQRAIVGVVATLLGTFVLGLIASCGGGTEQYQAFTPNRLIVFGDETSYISPTGTKYNVMGVVPTTGVIDCTQEEIWVQAIADTYGMKFAECNPQAVEPRAIMRAQPGAKVADVVAQVEAQVAAGGFRTNDLSTVLAGENDILELYSQFPGRTVDDLSAEAGQRGKELALVVNRLVGLGVKVLISDVPDVGLTPYAIAQKALDPNVDRAAVLSQITTAFNQQLGVNVVLDGRYVGLVQAQLRFQAIGISPGAFGFLDIVTPICTVALPDCTTATLIPGAITTQYLWSDDTHLSTGGQSQLSSLAIARASGNPF